MSEMPEKALAEALGGDWQMAATVMRTLRGKGVVLVTGEMLTAALQAVGFPTLNTMIALGGGLFRQVPVAEALMQAMSPPTLAE